LPRALSCAEDTERAKNAELAARWPPATTPFGRQHQVQVSEAAVLEDMRRAGWHVRQPGRQAELEHEAGWPWQALELSRPRSPGTRWPVAGY
jgi:hypothetical protein